MATTDQNLGFDPLEIERRWRERWEADPVATSAVDRPHAEEKFYNLVEFPYPSAEGLHVGHVYTYCGADVIGRYLRMRGRSVFQPIGFDSFGIHTENYALRIGEHPESLTALTIARYRQQLKSIGAAWDWNHELATSDPSYYRWTQWIFVQLHRAGLAVWEDARVVWCPSCLTVLAYEQLEGDRCERCNSVVTTKVMKQWFLRITRYADELVDGLEALDWPERAKEMQREWIGRSDGVEIDFPVEEHDLVLHAFTTRPETVFGVTFVALAPDHPDAEAISSAERLEEVCAFVSRARADGAASHRHRLVIEGVSTGAHALNPVNGKRVPIYVANYVVGGYGSGVVMGVPAHDEHDCEFASAQGLPAVDVIVPGPGTREGPWTGEGTVVASGRFSGLPSTAARSAITDHLEKLGHGRRTRRYRLHDWLISRQRYWGPPIPIVHCEGCGPVPVPEEDLPVLLPHIDDFRPTGTALSPLAGLPGFVQTDCPRCGGPGRRETDVSDTFLDSSWYYLRYPSSDRVEAAWDPELTRRLLPVDFYAGGIEHVVRHHLYARFVVRTLHDLGLVAFAEPFPKLRLHGLLVKDGAKMSKSRGNVVVPDDYIALVGADTLRMYLLFCGDWQQGGDFRDDGLRGMVRLARRLYSLVTEPHWSGPGGVGLETLHRSVVAVETALEALKFNTAIAALMTLVRWAASEKSHMSQDEWEHVRDAIVLVFAPFAPHLSEELWERIGNAYSVHSQRWPTADASALQRSSVQLVVQVDGRTRDVLEVPSGLDERRATEIALESNKARKHVDGRKVSRIVYIEDQLINFVLSR
jgi:leucyl-tRNA synthetase